jgi:starch phosphorylase
VNQPAAAVEDVVSGIEESIRRHVKYSLGKTWSDLSPREAFTAVALSVRDRLVDGMLETDERMLARNPKRVHYLSIEFLIGRSLGANLDALGLHDAYREAARHLGLELEAIEESEEDAALGNGGLGRLAACFMDSLATLGMPASGYGIHYEYGLFKQEIDNGGQKEKPDNWLARGSPWDIASPDDACILPVYGRIEHGVDRAGAYNPMWMDWKVIVGVPHDILIPGYGGRTVNRLRLYAARSSQDFDMQIFNDGDYFKAVERKIASETISKVLYPSDAVVAGRELRLLQEYFLVGCAIRDIVRQFERTRGSFSDFSSKVAIQMNDTHPALAVCELMRVLVDEKDLGWDEAFDVTRATLGYTNHTLAPEALERWPVSLLESVLPRHLQILHEINRRFLEEVARARPGDVDRLRRMSLIEESEPKQVRMTNLAIVGSHSINGVSALHTRLVETSLVPDFFDLWPERFNNKTNGIAQRRWLLGANPALASLVTAAIGDGWITDLDQLRGLEAHADDAGFREELRRVKRSNKERLGRIIRDTVHVDVDPGSLFDVQVKRIHGYKRQLLNVMHIVDEYLSLVEDGRRPRVSRTYLFAGKAAPGYWRAKQIIKLIHDVARVVNADARAGEWMKVVFLPDYRVSLAEKIIPSADLSEQISTAGKEASGTSNMKFALNGALTIGTLDGANIEILEAVGEENLFPFGMDVAAVRSMRELHAYRPWEQYHGDPRVMRLVTALASNLFCPREPGLHAWVKGTLFDEHDEYLHLADFSGYLDAHKRAGDAYANREAWSRSAILNVARIGRFSSDRTVREYARDVWNVE